MMYGWLMLAVIKLVAGIEDQWSDWTLWTNCIVSCGGGIQVRDRECENPIPGPDCIGGIQESQSCNTHDCVPANGNWIEWTPWTNCTDECGGGLQMRSRTCDNPPRDPEGDYCVGDHKDVRECNIQECVQPEVLDGKWSDWHEWSNCGVSCGDGVQLRERSCDNPSPGPNGRYCVGESHEARMCNTTICPPTEPVTDGDWRQWAPWSTCTVSCNGGLQLRERSCDNPAPGPNGRYCTGDSQGVRRCHTQQCVEPVCKDDMEPHFGRCYLFRTCKPGQCSWVEAVSACAAVGATLSNVANTEINELIVRKLPVQNVWLGANERDSVQGKADLWRWKDNRPLNNTFSNWANNYPVHGHHCALLNTHDGLWFSAPCHFGWAPMGYACEK